jgi:hypothetical protein
VCQLCDDKLKSRGGSDGALVVPNRRLGQGAHDAGACLSTAGAGSHTAVYDIAARTVYMPNGRRLEAHSGLGLMDDPSYVSAKGRRLRDLAVGTEECSRRGSNQRMALQENKKTDNFKPVVLSEFQAAVDIRS